MVKGQITDISRHLKMAYTESYSLSVQRELPWGMFLEAAYVGNVGKHLIRQPDFNQPAYATLVANLPATGSISGGLRNSLRPYKGYSGINMFLSDAVSNYNSFQTYLTKRKGNLNLTVGYAFSKALTDADGINQGEADNPTHLTNKHHTYAPPSSMPHQ